LGPFPSGSIPERDDERLDGQGVANLSQRTCRRLSRLAVPIPWEDWLDSLTASRTDASLTVGLLG
jgi:hypothetical protein